MLGVYFGWFWSHGGQTVAMKAWRIRVLCVDGGPLTLGRALLRFALAGRGSRRHCWPYGSAAPRPPGRSLRALTAGVVIYAALTRLHPDRQFWHDVVCGTRLVNWQPAAPVGA